MRTDISATVPNNADEFIATCKPAEADVVEDTVSQDYALAEVESHGEAEASPVCSMQSDGTACCAEGERSARTAGTAKASETHGNINITAKDNSVDNAPLENGNGFAVRCASDAFRRKLRIDKKRNVVLIEKDGTEKPISFREAEMLKRNSVLRLTQALACGADYGVVELDD